MKRSFRSLAAFLLAFFICLPAVVPPPAQAAGYKTASFWDLVSQGAICTALKERLQSYTSDTWDGKYEQYNADMREQLGTTEFGTQGFYITVPGDRVYSGKWTTIYSSEFGYTNHISYSSNPSFIPDNPTNGLYSWIAFSLYPSGHELYNTSYFPAPVDGYYTSILNYSVSGAAKPYILSVDSTISNHKLIQIGKKVWHSYLIYLDTSTPGALCDLIVSLKVFVEPLEYNLDSFGAGFGGGGSRGGGAGRDPNAPKIHYGIKQADNTIVPVQDEIPVFDEETMVFTNPETGASLPVTNWSYDYSDRSYHLTTTTQEGDTTTSSNVTVTYGDETIQIIEGDTTYNIYYMIPEGGGTGGGDDPSHKHSYTAETTTEPTCISAGVKKYTCAGCGDTYTEKIPALGHTWVLDRTVNTEYDENGNIVTQGYSIFKCSVCGNEYKDTTGAGPPDSGGGDDSSGGIFGTIIDFVVGLVKGVLGGLAKIIGAIVESLGSIVASISKVFAEIPGVFAGFIGFLSATFAYLPSEIITILTFGILAIVFVGIIKLFFK